MFNLAAALGLTDPNLVDPRLPAPQPVDPGARRAWRPGFFPIGLGLTRDGVLHLPRSLPRDRPAPLLIMLHGGGGEARSAITLLRPHAEQRGFAVLAPESRERGWSLDGPEAAFVGQALRRVYGSVAIDPRRVAVAGFSSGSRFGLALALANGDWLNAGLIFSAGGGLPAVVRRGRPRFVVTHGRIDQGPSFLNANNEIVRPLRTAGYAVDFHPFDGGHEMPPAQIRRALDRWLA